MAQDKKRLQFILDMVDNLTAPAAKANKSLQGMGKEVMGTQKKLKDLNKMAGDISNFKTMKAQMEANAATAKGLAANTEKLKAQMAATEKPTKAMRAALRASEKAEKDHAKTTHKHAQEMLKVEAALKRAKVPLDNLDRSERATNSAILRTNEALRKQQSELDKTTKRQEQLTKAKESHDKAMSLAGKVAGVGAGMMVGGGALMGGMYAAGSPFTGFDKQMSAVQALGGMSKSDKAMLADAARKEAAVSSFGAAEAASAQGFLAQAGFKPAEIKESLKGILDLAAATETGLAETADIGSNILSGFKLKADSMGAVGDLLTKTASTSNVDLRSLGETMKYVAPIAAASGQSIESMAAATGLLGNVGIKGSMAGTALKGAILRLAGPTREAQKAFDQLGVSTKDVNGNVRALPEVLADLSRQMEGMGSGDKLGMLKKMFGEEPAAAIAELLDKSGAGEIDAYIAELANSQGAADLAAKTRLDNLWGDTENLKSSAEELQLSFGELFDKAYRGIVRAATAATDWVTKFVKANPTLVKALGIAAMATGFVVAALGAVLVVLSPLIIAWAKWKLVMWAWQTVAKGTLAAIWGVIKAIVMKTASIGWFLVKGALMVTWFVVSRTAMIAWRVAGAAMRGIMVAITAAQWLWNAALAANPIGAVVMAIAALVGAGIWLYQNWERLPEIFSELWAKITEFVGFDPLGMISGAWDAVGDYFSNLFGGIWDSFMNTIGKIGEKLSGGMDWITGGFGMFDDEPTAEPVTKKLVEGGQIQPAQKTTVIEAPATYHVTIDASNMSAAELRAMFDKMAAEDRRKAEQKARARNKD